jgi:hypothetical protein
METIHEAHFKMQSFKRNKKKMHTSSNLQSTAESMNSGISNAGFKISILCVSFSIFSDVDKGIIVPVLN